MNFLVEGSVVPLLGPNINLCHRPPGVSWEPGQDQYLPSRDELSAYLACKYGSPSNLVSPLVRQAQYTAAMVSYQELHDELNRSRLTILQRPFISSWRLFLRSYGRRDVNHVTN